MSDEDLIDRWIRRGWERLRAVSGRSGLKEVAPLSAEALDLLRQLEQGLELRGRVRRRRTGSVLDEISSLAPLSSGLRRIRRPGEGAARPRSRKRER
jgi:hypothetical protein